MVTQEKTNACLAWHFRGRHHDHPSPLSLHTFPFADSNDLLDLCSQFARFDRRR
jgi:hypothetical protein